MSDKDQENIPGSSQDRPYYCNECKRVHTKGKIYKEHIQFAIFEDIEEDSYENNELELFDYEKEIDIKEEDFKNNGQKGIDAVKKLPGVGEVTLQKLLQAGYTSLESIAFTPQSIIQEETGLGEKTSAKLFWSSMDKLNKGLKSGYTIWKERENLNRLSTGSQELDDLIGGGLEPGTLTELFGEYRTGKTQICHQLCVNVQLPIEKMGLSGGAYYIDTNNSFRPERIIQMAKYLDLDDKTVLEKIIVDQAYHSDHQIVLVKKAKSTIQEYGIKLLVIDNIISHFLAEYIGRGSFDLLMRILRSHFSDLHRLTQIYPDLVIVYTNQVEVRPEVFYGEPIGPLGWNVVAHAATTRIYLKKGMGEQRIAKLKKSPHLPEGEATFSITEDGIY